MYIYWNLNDLGGVCVGVYFTIKYAAAIVFLFIKP